MFFFGFFKGTPKMVVFLWFSFESTKQGAYQLTKTLDPSEPNPPQRGQDGDALRFASEEMKSDRQADGEVSEMPCATKLGSQPSGSLAF